MSDLNILHGREDLNQNNGQQVFKQITSTLDDIKNRLDVSASLVGATGSGLATEVTLQEVSSKLADLKTYTDQLESYVDGLEGLTQQIVDATDNIEPLISSTNTVLSNIYDAIDTVETLLGTANTTAGSILTAVDQLEGFTDELEGKLDTLTTFLQGRIDVNLSTRASESTLSAFKSENNINIGTSNTILTAIYGALGIVDTDLNTFATQNHTDILSVQGKLDTIHSDQLTIQSILQAATGYLQSIDLGIPASLGQNTMANSMPVVISNDQTPVAIKNPQTGTTIQFSQVINTSNVSIPATGGGGDISEVLVRCATDNIPNTKRLYYSFDGGLTFGSLSPGEFIGWAPRGSLKQIIVKASTTSVSGEFIVNREP